MLRRGPYLVVQVVIYHLAFIDEIPEELVDGLRAKRKVPDDIKASCATTYECHKPTSYETNRSQ